MVSGNWGPYEPMYRSLSSPLFLTPQLLEYYLIALKNEQKNKAK